MSMRVWLMMFDSPFNRSFCRDDYQHQWTSLYEQPFFFCWLSRLDRLFCALSTVLLLVKDIRAQTNLNCPYPLFGKTFLVDRDNHPVANGRWEINRNIATRLHDYNMCNYLVDTRKYKYSDVSDKKFRKRFAIPRINKDLRLNRNVLGATERYKRYVDWIAVFNKEYCEYGLQRSLIEALVKK